MGDKPLTGCFHKTAQGRESYEIFDADSDFLFQVVAVLESRFNFQAMNKPLDGMDVIYWDFARDEIKVTVGWDIWSGCFVFATTEAGDEIVKEIGQYLDGVLHEALPKTDRA